MKLFKSGSMPSLALISAGVFVALFAMGCKEPTECNGNGEDEQCTEAGEICAQFNGEENALGDGRCLAACTSIDDCPTGFTCTTNANDRNLNVCAELTDDFEEGRDCVFDVQCASGACIGDDSVRVCYDQCTGDEDCAEGKLCYVFGGRNICERPAENPKELNEECENPTECDSRRCVVLPHFAGVNSEDDIGGRCVAGCETNETCAENENCAELVLGGRVCVQLAENGDDCTTPDTCFGEGCIRLEPDDNDSQTIEATTCASSCSENGICPETEACVTGDNNTGASFCVPVNEDAAENGESCEEARDCQSGLCRTFPVPSGDENTQTLCGEACDGVDQCGEGRECWQTEEGFNGPDVCGPAPQ